MVGMNRKAKFFIEWVCPVCGHKNKKQVYETVSCSKCSYYVETPFLPNKYIIFNERLVKEWRKIRKKNGKEEEKG